MPSGRIPPRVGALVAVILWGISFVATKAALREVSPVTLIFLRFFIGAVLLAIIVRKLAPRDERLDAARSDHARAVFHRARRMARDSAAHADRLDVRLVPRHRLLRVRLSLLVWRPRAH